MKSYKQWVPSSSWGRLVIPALIAAICAILPLVLQSSGNKLPSTAVAILQRADSFELLSLDPRLQIPPENRSFHGYRVLNRVTISEANTRQKLVSTLLQGM